MQMTYWKENQISTKPETSGIASSWLAKYNSWKIQGYLRQPPCEHTTNHCWDYNTNRLHRVHAVTTSPWQAKHSRLGLQSPFAQNRQRLGCDAWGDAFERTWACAGLFRNMREHFLAKYQSIKVSKVILLLHRVWQQVFDKMLTGRSSLDSLILQAAAVISCKQPHCMWIYRSML